MAGERDLRRLAALGTGLKASPEALTAALTGRFSDRDAFLLEIYLEQVDPLDRQIATLSAWVGQMAPAMPPPARQSGTPEPAGATVMDGVPGTVSTVTGEIIPPAAGAPGRSLEIFAILIRCGNRWRP